MSAGPDASRPARAWIQVNARLARPGGAALPSARALFRELETVLPRWRRERLVSHCFFQRKPPDLRLRFRGPRDALLARLHPMMARMTAEGHVIRSFDSVYEPEARQFGGPNAMRHVHAYWSADSGLWITLDRLMEAGSVRIPHATLMIAALNDLFGRTLNDGGEVWDTWCNLLVLLRDEGAVPISAAPPPMLDALVATASEAEGAILDGYRHANMRLAAGLIGTWEQGRLRCGLRAILPYAAMFTLNRHGFDQAAATTIARAMAAAWNPKAGLRGALPDRRIREAG